MRIDYHDRDVAGSRLLPERLRSFGIELRPVEIGWINGQELPVGQATMLLFGLAAGDAESRDILESLIRRRVRRIVAIAPADAPAVRCDCLNLGADDVVDRATSDREIALRLFAVARRASDTAGEMGWRLSVARRELMRPDGRLVALTAAEFDCLNTLIERVGETVSRDTLFAAAFRRPYHPLDRAVDTLISKLRIKLGDDPPRLIRTMRPVGYMFTGFEKDDSSSDT